MGNQSQKAAWFSPEAIAALDIKPQATEAQDAINKWANKLEYVKKNPRYTSAMLSGKV